MSMGRDLKMHSAQNAFAGGRIKFLERLESGAQQRKIRTMKGLYEIPRWSLKMRGNGSSRICSREESQKPAIERGTPRQRRRHLNGSRP